MPSPLLIFSLASPAISQVRPSRRPDGNFTFPLAAPSALREAFDRNGGRRISNACQNCGWFSYHIKHWPRWDGQRLGCKARYRPLRYVKWLHTAALYVPNRIAQKIFD